MSKLPLRPERLLFSGFILLVLMLAALTGWQWRNGVPVTANLLDILPHSEHGEMVEEAQQRMQTAMQRELVLLIHHPHVLEKLPLWAGQLQDSNLFHQVDYRIEEQLGNLGRQLLDGRSYLVPLAVRQQLANDPKGYLAARTQALFDPLASFSLVSIEQDWLGLTGSIQESLQQQARVQADNQGHLYVNDGQQSWYLLRLQTQQSSFDGDSSILVAAEIATLRQQIEQDGGQLLAGGGLLFNASAQQQAQGEIQWLGSLSLLGSLALILLFFRRLHSLLAALPAVFGLWLGITACIAVFGQVHAITLVLGVS